MGVDKDSKSGIYETTILFNPKWYQFFTSSKITRMTVDKNGITIFAEKTIKIPTSDIKELKFNAFINGSVKVICHSGKRYNFAWTPESKWAPRSVLETQNVYDNLKRILRMDTP